MVEWRGGAGRCLLVKWWQMRAHRDIEENRTGRSYLPALVYARSEAFSWQASGIWVQSKAGWPTWGRATNQTHKLGVSSFHSTPLTCSNSEKEGRWQTPFLVFPPPPPPSFLSIEGEEGIGRLWKVLHVWQAARRQPGGEEGDLLKLQMKWLRIQGPVWWRYRQPWKNPFLIAASYTLFIKTGRLSW